MTEKWKSLELRRLPGHFARRVHQLAVALFVQEVGDLNLTPVQYSTLQTICNQPGIDQKTLANAVGYDTSTIAGVIDRLEARGLLVRTVSPTDRRARLITPTKKGLDTLEAVVPRMLKSQERLLEPLTKAERKEFMRLLQVLIDANAELSNIPTKE
ncbi:MAG TPA: MarR family transcriptional regulator [Roseimicrobium sp.]|nr:MarR family transcriptional regulator [Roseimicrobium sp.]